MTITRISLAAAKAQLPAFVDSVATKSDRYVIERDGKPVAALIPVSELQRLEQDDVEPTGLELLFGSIPEDAEEEWDAIIGEVYRSRRAGFDEPLPSGEPPGALAPLGALADVPDDVIDALVDEIYAARNAGIDP